MSVVALFFGRLIYNLFTVPGWDFPNTIKC